MKWYNYLACFFAGVFLIHLVPHVLNLMHGFAGIDIVGALVSLGVGLLLLWAGRFSFKNPWAILLFIAGMASVLIFTVLHPHHVHGHALVTERMLNAPMS